MKEMKEEQQALKTELETVTTQTKQVQEQLDTMTRSQALNIPTNNSSKVSYADMRSHNKHVILYFNFIFAWRGITI